MTDNKGSSVKPLRRFRFNEAFVPIERKNLDGSGVFYTRDQDKYIRDVDTGVIRRATPKINGKLAKKARRCQRLTQR